MKKIYLNLCVVTSLFAGLKANAQMSGAYSVPGSFPTLAAAITNLNAVGVSGPVTINIAAGYTETAPVGGYSLTATGTAANTISFIKSGSGANPLLTAFAGGTGTPGTAVQDGIWRLIGSDYVTIASIDLVDLNTSNPATMEFGYGLYKAGATDGCQHNIIAGCTITLSRLNNAAGIMPAVNGSRGINMVNATAAANTTPLIITAASGSNSNNGFYANTIRNCNYGISLTGYNDVFPFAFSDSGTNISGNTISNFGGAPAAANAAGGVITTWQQNLVITGNTFNSNDGSGADHANDLRGIYVTTAGGVAGNLSGNNITLHGGGTVSQVTAIEVTGTVTASGSSLDINGNTIRKCTYATATSGNFYGIHNASSVAALGINGNNFYNNSTAGVSGGYYSIYNSGNVTGSIAINANTVDTLNFTAASVSSTVCGIYCAASGNQANAGINGNTFKNINYVGSTGMYAGICFTANADTAYLTGNSLNDLHLNSSGPVYFVYNNSSTALMQVFGNSVTTGFTRTNGTGDTYFYYGAGNAASGTANISFNNITNVSQSGTSAFYGVYTNAPAVQNQIVSGNTFDAITSGSGITSIISMTSGSTSACYNNTISNITAGGVVYGIQCNAGIASNKIYQNSVYGFTGTGASSVYPVYVAGNSQAVIYRNKIYDIANTNATGSAYGIYLAANSNTISGQSDTLSNNLIGQIETPAANAAMPLAGIYIGGGTNVKAWYNSVYLNGSSTGSLFGSTALFASVATGVELKNNLLVNESSPSGAGITSAYLRNGSNLSSYLAGSDHNLFYAGTPAATHVIFSDGATSYAFLSDYKTLVSGKDVLSVTENPPFISTVGSDPDFLNIDPSIATQVEEGATPITLVPEDYAASTRNITTPDIGAWEINGTLSGDVLYPTLLAQAFTGNNCSTTARTLTVSLTDVSGIAAGSLSPRVYYKVNTGSYTSVQGSLSSGTALNGVWTFNLSYAASAMDVISYYVVAQDIATTPNVLASPATGFAGTGVSAITSPPTSLYSYTISIPVVSVATSTACAGNTASLTATGTGASAYAWSGPLGYSSTASTALIPSVSNAAAGIYTLTATSASGCSVTTTASLTVNASPVVTASINSATICSGQSAILTATGAVTYVWMPGNMSASTVTVTPASSTNYTVTGTNALGCSRTATLSLMVNPCTGIDENAILNSSIRMFPNPTSGFVTLEMPFEGSKEIIISNTLGQTVQYLYSANNSETLNLATLPKGIYLVKVLSPIAGTQATLIVE